MQVTVTLSHGDIYQLTTELPDNVDTTNWTRGDWMELAEAIHCARFYDRERLIQIAGDIKVQQHHIEGDSEVLFVEAEERTVIDSFDAQKAMLRALKQAKAWCAQQPECWEILSTIDEALSKAE